MVKEPKKMTHEDVIDWLARNKNKIDIKAFAVAIKMDSSQLSKAIRRVALTPNTPHKIPADKIPAAIKEIESFGIDIK